MSKLEGLAEGAVGICEGKAPAESYAALARSLREVSQSPPRHRTHGGTRPAPPSQWQERLRSGPRPTGRGDENSSDGAVWRGATFPAPALSASSPRKGYGRHGHEHHGHHLTPTRCLLNRLETTKFAYDLRKNNDAW
jgi:hypothetical protein